MKRIFLYVGILLVGIFLVVSFAPASRTAPPAALALQSATFFGGAGDQRGTALAMNGIDIYVSAWNLPPGGLHALLIKYATPPVAPLWSAALNNAHFNGLGLTATTAYPVGAAAPPVCGASDGAGDTERKSLLARYNSAGGSIGCSSPNFFPYRGHETYNTALAVTEGVSTYVYAAGRAEQTGFARSLPFVLVKYDASGIIVNQVSEPGIVIGSFGCCPGESDAQGLAALGGNLYVAGFSRLPGFGEDNLIRPALMKYDSSLSRIWKARPTDNPGGMFRAVAAFGGDLYAVGNTSSGGSANYLIEKYDVSGARLWSVTSGGGAEDVLTGVIGIGGRLFAVGYTRSSGSGGADAVLLEINPADGATLSTTLYGGAQDDMANGVATDGTDLYVVGEARSFASAEGNLVGQNDVLLLRYALNQAPTAICQDVTVAAGADCTATASIDNGSFDADSGDSITLTQSPPGPYPLGTTNVALTVTDSQGASSQCAATVTIVDTSPPVVTNASATPASLWPPNHKMVTVTINYNVTDNCASPSASNCTLNVTSNEPINGTGDGDMAPDWEIVDAHHVKLRAERAGSGNGRIYTITITCTDANGNSSSQSVTVTVPKNRS